MTPHKKLWRREPHTEGKHLVLRKYLDAWLPILGSWNGRILFIDGFAGPGEYEGGEPGSPMVAINALLEHNSRRAIKGEVVFLFIEKDAARATHLKGMVDSIRHRLPPNVHAHVEVGAFDLSMGDVLKELDRHKEEMAPAFVMVDPFGVSGTPFEIIARLMANPRCEVYISFMYEAINRFISTQEFLPHLDELFGTDKWQEAITLNGRERRKFLYALYESQLRSAGAEHVVHFDLRKGSRLVYSIFFGTHHWKGCDRMKQAIWGVAPFGDYAFVGSHTGQLVLGVAQPNLVPLQEALCSRFEGADWIPIEDVVAFVGSDATDYHTGQLKLMTLKPMEDGGQLAVKAGTRKRRGSFPEGSLLQFRC